MALTLSALLEERRPLDWMWNGSLECVAAVGFLLVWWVFIHRFSQRNYKGPKSWPIIGCILEQAKNFDTLHDWLLKYFRTLLTFSVPMVSINNTFTADPSNVEYILKTNFHNFPKGERIHERFEDMLGNGIFNVDGELWRQQRKVAILEFSSAKLRDYSTDAFRGEAIKLVEVLAVAAETGQVVDLQDLFMRLTLDSICKIGFGVDLGNLSPLLPAVPFANAFDDGNRLIVRRYVDMFWKVKRYFNVGAEAKLRKCIQEVDSFIYDVIDKRRAEMKTVHGLGKHEKSDILSRFMSMDNENHQPYTDKQLRDIVVNFIIAGRDTTALTLSWFFLMLCKHPRVVDNILEEVTTVLGELKTRTAGAEEELKGCAQSISRSNSKSQVFSEWVSDFAGSLNYQVLNRMHYLHAAVTETLRLYPAVPLDTKIALSDDVLPDGTKVRQGNFVSYVPYSMGRLQTLWGPDAAEFKPERWLKHGVFQPQSPYKLTAFQAGPRMCLGKDSAYLQMKMTTVLLLRFFKFHVAEGHPFDYSMMLVLYIAKGLKTIVSQR